VCGCAYCICVCGCSVCGVMCVSVCVVCVYCVCAVCVFCVCSVVCVGVVRGTELFCLHKKTELANIRHLS